MTQIPVAPIPAAQRTNGLGLAGFIIAIIGILFTAGLLNVVGLFLSIFAMSKGPRDGLTIAGFVINVVCCCLGLFIWVLFGMAILAAIGITAAAVIALGDFERLEMTTDMAQVAVRIAEYEEANGALPATLSAVQLNPNWLTDPWGNEYEYHFVEEAPGFDLVSLGKDGQSGTEDDVRLSDLGASWGDKGFSISSSGSDSGGTVRMKFGNLSFETTGDDEGGSIIIRDGNRVMKIEGNDEGGSITTSSESSEPAAEGSSGDTGETTGGGDSE